MNVTFEGKSSTGKNEWLTPPYLLDRLGEFDLDPYSPVNCPWDTARHHYTVGYDTPLIVRFIRKCVEHRNAIALTFARTDTRLFHELIFPYADTILFIRGRLRFYHVTREQGGSAGVYHPA